jgi:hypothetical protein
MNPCEEPLLSKVEFLRRAAAADSAADGLRGPVRRCRIDVGYRLLESLVDVAHQPEFSTNLDSTGEEPSC